MLGRARRQRHLATVLFTDIVGSTERAAALGDRRWRQVIGEHHALLRRALRRYGGHEVDTAGDGLFATFPTPAAAVECAQTVVQEISARLGIDIRAGVHTGEVEQAGPKVGGIAVHIGARVLSLAGPGEVLVTSTVRELVGGSGLRFVDRGTHDLRGVPEPWHLYALERGVAPTEAGADGGLTTTETGRRVASGRRTIAVVVPAVLVGALAAILLARIATSPSSSVAALRADTVVALDRNGARAASYGVGANPTSIVAGDGSLWVANLGSSTVTRVEPGGGPDLTVGGVGRPSALAFDESAARVWVLDGFAGRIAVVDARNGQVLESFPQSGRSIAIGGGLVWIADEIGDAVVAIDVTSRQVAAEIPLPAGTAPVALAIAQDAIWVAGKGSSAIERIDPSTRTRIEPPVSVAVRPTDLAIGTSLWIASEPDDAVVRLDRADGRVSRSYPSLCDEPSGMAVIGDGAWVTCRRDGSVLHMEAEGVTVTAPLGFVPNDVAVAGEHAWVTLAGD